MRKTPLFALALTVLLATACTQQEQQAVTDTLTSESSSSEMVFEFSSSSEEASSVAEQVYVGEESSSVAQVRTQQQASVAAKSKGRYVTYNAAALQDGYVKVLFFHAGWCPLCKTADTSLNGWYGSDATAPDITVYKVNYDTETDLKAAYGVTYQHTFVKVDGQGNMIAKIQTPSEEQLKEFLGV